MIDAPLIVADTQDGGSTEEPCRAAHIEEVPRRSSAECSVRLRHRADYPPSNDGLVFIASEGGPIRLTNWQRRIWHRVGRPS